MTQAKRGRKKSPWNAEIVRAMQAQVKDEISAAAVEKLPRLHFILKQVESAPLESEQNPHVRRYIYCISALVHHLRFGGLSEQQIGYLAKIAFSILDLNGIPETSSPNSFLYEDIHLVLGHIHRKKGNHWLSAWQHESASRSSVRDQQTRKAVSLLGSSIRKLRLGMASEAIEGFRESISLGLDQHHLGIASTNLIKSLRLLRRIDEAAAAAKELQKPEFTTGAIAKEFLWEEATRKLLTQIDLSPMVSLVGRSGPLSKDGPFVLEAFFWAYACPETKYMERVSTPRAMSRTFGADMGGDKLFLEFAACLHDCYDYNIPFNSRIRRLGEVLAKSSELLTIDRELLVWAAAARWLMRSRTHSLIEITFAQYEQLSQRLSGGNLKDLLGFFKEGRASSASNQQESKEEENVEEVKELDQAS